MEEYLAKYLIHIILECDIHEHNVIYKKNKHTDTDKDYHMSYP